MPDTATSASPVLGDVPIARFDDLRTGERLQFSRARRVIEAHDLAQVVPALREVQAAVDAGNWAFGMVSYEAAPALDPGLATHQPTEGLPLVWFGITDAPDAVPDPLPAPLMLQEGPGRLGPMASMEPDWTRHDHAANVAAVHAAIAAGTTYQVNLTTRFRGRLPPVPTMHRQAVDATTANHQDMAREMFRIHADLAARQQGSHHAFLDTGRHVIASASPECFLDWRGADLVSRPMKGTMPRGDTPLDDERARTHLLHSAKDAAENVMIVDLIRNDLSRIACTGSVEVEELLSCEAYPTVWQLVSSIRCRTRPDVGLVEALGALFPCGSITGAPKGSTMRLVAGLEDSARGVYCGTIGFLQPAHVDGRRRVSLSVAIRTLVLDTATGGIEYGVGGGITWDSTADAEYDELLAKTAVLGAGPGLPGCLPEEGLLELPPGEGLLETFAVRAGIPVHLAQHLDRLEASARCFGIACDRAAIGATVLAHAATLEQDSLVRVRLATDGTFDLRARPLVTQAGPVLLAIDGQSGPVPPFSAHKTTLRSHFARARARHPQADDVVLVNARGHVTESTTATVAALIDGQWCTPPLSDGCLPGVGRTRAIARGELVERSLTPGDLCDAESLALISSARGWRTAMLLAGPADG